MYLALLDKEQKELFLELAFDIAWCDGDFGDEEQKMIAGYCQEMQISFFKDKMGKPIEDVITKLNSITDEKCKKIIVFEAIGLAMSDNNFDENERKIVSHMIEVFDLNHDFLCKCEQILSEYIVFQEKINQLIIDK